jgi:hypothetical protein
VYDPALYSSGGVAPLRPRHSTSSGNKPETRSLSDKYGDASGA